MRVRVGREASQDFSRLLSFSLPRQAAGAVGRGSSEGTWLVFPAHPFPLSPSGAGGAMGRGAGHPPITQFRLGLGAPGLGTAAVPHYENAGVPGIPLAPTLQAPAALPAPATLCRAAPRVRFPSAHNERGNIYSVARAHLIFMRWLFIDGERLLLMGRGATCARCPQNLWGFSFSRSCCGCRVPPPLPGGWSQRACLAKELCSRGEQRRLQDFSLGRG